MLVYMYLYRLDLQLSDSILVPGILSIMFVLSTSKIVA